MSPVESIHMSAISGFHGLKEPSALRTAIATWPSAMSRSPRQNPPSGVVPVQASPRSMNPLSSASPGIVPVHVAPDTGNIPWDPSRTYGAPSRTCLAMLYAPVTRLEQSPSAVWFNHPWSSHRSYHDHRFVWE